MTHPTIQRLYDLSQAEDDAFLRSPWGEKALLIENSATKPTHKVAARLILKAQYLENRANEHDGEPEAARCDELARQLRNQAMGYMKP